MNVTVELEGLDDLLDRFRGVERGMLDFRQLGAWKGVQSVFYKLSKEQFGSEGGAGRSGKWAALSTGYAKVKQKRYGANPILQATGKLYRSLTSQGGDSVVEMQAQELTLGTKVPYAGYHQSGTNKMPRREVISFTEEQEKQLLEPIKEKLVQLVINAKLSAERGF